MSMQRELFIKFNNIDKSILLIGPRQVGKSTLIRQLQPNLEINLADEEVYLKHLSDPGLLKKIIGKNQTIFIDEVQRIPSILNTVQSLIDNNKKLQFYLTGSSARKLKRGQANLLPGRILSFEMGPLTCNELKNDFNLDRALTRGLLPGIYLEESEEIAKKTLRTYAAVYLKEEVQAEALTRNIEGFSRFFQVISSRSGDFLDVSKFSSQAMIERTSASRYFEILTDTLVINAVDPFTKSTRRRLIQHPRYYFFDVGVLNGALGNFSPSADRIGNLFEHLFLQLLLSMAKARDKEIRVSVYRTDAGAEVDFIVESANELFAIEVKATKTIGKSDLRGLKSFREFYGKKHTSWVAYLGDDTWEEEEITVAPWRQVLQALE